MKYIPVSLTSEEIKEIASLEELRKSWGKTYLEMIKILENSASAKFVAHEENMKEVFALLPEALDSYVPAFKIARTIYNNLIILG